MKLFMISSIFLLMLVMPISDVHSENAPEAEEESTASEHICVSPRKFPQKPKKLKPLKQKKIKINQKCLILEIPPPLTSYKLISPKR